LWLELKQQKIDPTRNKRVLEGRGEMMREWENPKFKPAEKAETDFSAKA